MDNTQIGLAGFDDNDDTEYEKFMDKFKPKKTTDDCYTPQPVMDVIIRYCAERYGIPPEKQVRPFYPGGDYESFEYPDGCVVVDNPPFSILSAIVDWYNWKGIRYFLFAPYLINFNYGIKCTHIVTDVTITYENGAKVNTAFITNLEPGILCRSDPELNRRLEAADAARNAEKTELPKYSYPSNVLTATMVGNFSKRGIPFVLHCEDACHIRALDSQKRVGKAIFGSGFLMSSAAAAAAAEKKNVVVWELSDRERATILELDKRGKEVPDDA